MNVQQQQQLVANALESVNPYAARRIRECAPPLYCNTSSLCPRCGGGSLPHTRHQRDAALQLIQGRALSTSGLLTLTVVNEPVDQLRQNVHILQRCRREILQRKVFRGQVATMNTIEVTRAEDGRAHPHSHSWVVFNQAVSPERRAEMLSEGAEVWQSIANLNYRPHVHMSWPVDRVHARAQVHYVGKAHMDIETMLDDAPFIREAAHQLAGVKLFSTSGALHGNAYRA